MLSQYYLKATCRLRWQIVPFKIKFREKGAEFARTPSIGPSIDPFANCPTASIFSTPSAFVSGHSTSVPPAKQPSVQTKAKAVRTPNCSTRTKISKVFQTFRNQLRISQKARSLCQLFQFVTTRNTSVEGIPTCL